MALGWTMGLNAGSSVPEGGCSFTFITWGERRASPEGDLAARGPVPVFGELLLSSQREKHCAGSC